ncbi:hypothetical protein C1M53_03510 [Mesorhizobium sp. Pch-S]|nr:hypothetical protein C1M53_03510 [Mesorhizobium sp. Pch-S]
MAGTALPWLELAGVLLVMVSILWWAVVYAQVMANTGFSAAGTLPCLLYTSDRCSLAMALCKDWHFLGIKRYSAELLWLGVAAAAIAILAGGFFGNTDRPEES